MSQWLVMLQGSNRASAVVEIVLLFAFFYLILRFLQGTRGAGVLRGLVFFVIMALIVVLFVLNKLPLYRISFLLEKNPLIFLLLIVVLFQPEIRRLLLRLGEAPMLRWLFRIETSVLPEIVNAAFTLAEKKVGALITIEREVGLGDYIERGILLNAAVTQELLVTIFWPGSPLHDGAVIIRGNRVAAAGCLFPLTDQPGLARTSGTRHRAAIGVTERSDALSIVVSEETQQISVSHRGRLRMGLDRDQLLNVLQETFLEAVPTTGAEAPSG